MAGFPSFTPTYHHDQYPAINPTQPALDCSNKIIFITGGGRGIGKSIALAFAQAHAKGIALLGRTQSSLQETSDEIAQLSPSTNVFLAPADIQDQNQVQSVLDAIISHFSAVPDVLVNNAGALRGVGPLIDVDIEEFWASFGINAKGPLIVAQAFLRANRTHSPGSKRTIINISSGAAHNPYSPGAAAYSVAKLANTKITEYLHYENPEWTIVTMQPGVIATSLAGQAGRKASDSGRLPGGLSVWLATREEAKWFNGKFLWANWDIDELLGRKEEIEEKDLLTMCLKGWTEMSANELMEIAAGLHRNADKE